MHITLEAMTGGPIAAVKNGDFNSDFIELDAYSGQLHLNISNEEMLKCLAI